MVTSLSHQHSKLTTRLGWLQDLWWISLGYFREKWGILEKFCFHFISVRGTSKKLSNLSLQLSPHLIHNKKPSINLVKTTQLKKLTVTVFLE